MSRAALLLGSVAGAAAAGYRLGVVQASVLQDLLAAVVAGTCAFGVVEIVVRSPGLLDLRERLRAAWGRALACFFLMCAGCVAVGYRFGEAEDVGVLGELALVALTCAGLAVLCLPAAYLRARRPYRSE